MEKLLTLPIVSVIIPNYNRTTVLQRAIKSVLHQTYSNLEIIIVDDASSIDPTSYIEIFQDKRITLIRLKKNGGAAKARNHGAKLAKGDFIAFLDSDDEWLLNHLEQKMKILLHQKADGCYGAVVKLNNGIIIDAPPVRLPASNETMTSYLFSGILRAATPSLVLKKAAFLDIQFNEAFIVHEDYDMVIRFAQKYTWVCDPIPSLYVHISKTGLSANVDFASSIAFLKQHAQYIEFKWLFFYCLRKISIAYKKKSLIWIEQYLAIINSNINRANFLYRFNHFLFKKFSRTYLFFFESVVTLAYKIRGFYARK